MNEKEFKKLLDDEVKKVGEIKLEMDRKGLKTFCELTGHDADFYFENNLIPQGYFMTMTIPVFNSFFTAAFANLMPKVIKGVIHTSSKIEFHRPMRIDRKYTGKMTVARVEAKSGSLGDYFASDFEVVVLNEKGNWVASDLHQFFMRI